MVVVRLAAGYSEGTLGLLKGDEEIDSMDDAVASETEVGSENATGMQ